MARIGAIRYRYCALRSPAEFCDDILRPRLHIRRRARANDPRQASLLLLGCARHAGAGPIGVGTDAGGSTLIPAACNGVVGFKQSAGVVPHDTAPEAFANISSINPMARTVMDAALMLEVMAGQHPSDPYSYGAPST